MYYVYIYISIIQLQVTFMPESFMDLVNKAFSAACQVRGLLVPPFHRPALRTSMVVLPCVVEEWDNLALK